MDALLFGLGLAVFGFGLGVSLLGRRVKGAAPLEYDAEAGLSLPALNKGISSRDRRGASLGMAGAFFMLLGGLGVLLGLL